MPELLLELGTEELPASFVRRAMNDLHDAIALSLKEAGLSVAGETTVLGTPRRLIIGFGDVPPVQPDSVKEMRGPALKAAFNENGDALPALIGFCRSQGVEVTDLRKDEQYVWVTKKIAGRPTREILSEVLPKAIRGLNFDKSMRWGSSRMRFARPIRWILAVFDQQVVPFEIEGVHSQNLSRGHRFYAPEPFVAEKMAELIDGLRERHVEPDPAARWAKIENESKAVAKGHPEMSTALLEENTFLTEWPTPIRGTFREEFMSLPEPVLITAMAKHEKMFPVRDEEGRLTNAFVFIRNSGEDETVQGGCEWVLNARFNDAKFFFDEDSKRTLGDFLERTESILFQEKLGTVRRRADRLADLSEAIARATGADDREAALAAQAGRYAKADLSTGLVGELTSLQGVIGAEYAARESFAPEVVAALRTQYDPGNIGVPEEASSRTATRLVIAESLDKLAGYLGLGLTPSGSSDPYGLRRAATILIEAAWNWPTQFPSLSDLLTQALAIYQSQGVELNHELAQASFQELLASRYSTLMSDVPYDVLEASISRPAEPKVVRFQTELLRTLAKNPSFVQTATRPLNILAAARKKGIEVGTGIVDINKLDSSDGNRLAATLENQAEALALGAKSLNVEETISLLNSLAAPINAFFESTMVMAEDESIRNERLRLLNQCAGQLLVAGDFTKLVIEG